LSILLLGKIFIWVDTSSLEEILFVAECFSRDILFTKEISMILSKVNFRGISKVYRWLLSKNDPGHAFTLPGLCRFVDNFTFAGLIYPMGGVIIRIELARRNKRMTDILKKAIALGLGITAVSREKIQNFVDDLVAKGELGQSESKDMVNNLIAKGEEQREEIGRMVREQVKKVLADLDIATRQDLKELEEKLQSSSNPPQDPPAL
jgi:polyhydroxyalkanoate synthesis regulator phasin